MRIKKDNSMSIEQSKDNNLERDVSQEQKMGSDQEYETYSEQETFELGYEFAKGLKPGDSISLEGDLGTGKTAFTKGIAAGLGVTQHITSPTFTLVNTYNGEKILHHFDVYRVNDPDELFAIGWVEYFSYEAVTVVEWGDLVPDILPENTIHIRFSRLDGSSYEGRRIIIER